MCGGGGRWAAVLCYAGAKAEDGSKGTTTPGLRRNGEDEEMRSRFERTALRLHDSDALIIS
jgi:hypothetical protein